MELLVVMVVAMSAKTLLETILDPAVVLVALEVLISLTIVDRLIGSFIGKRVLMVTVVKVNGVVISVGATVVIQLSTRQGFVTVTTSTGQHGDPPHCRDKLADIFSQMGRSGALLTISYLWKNKV